LRDAISQFRDDTKQVNKLLVSKLVITAQIKPSDDVVV